MKPFVLTAIATLAMIQVSHAQYSFGTQSQSTPSASTTFSSGNNQFQYNDTANATDDYAFLPLTGVNGITGNATTVVTSSTGWSAALNVTLVPTQLTSDGTHAPYVGMGLNLGFGSGGHTYSVSINLSQYNNAGGAATTKFGSGAYGTAVSFVAQTDNVNQPTTPLASSQIYSGFTFNGSSILPLSSGTSGTAGFQQINRASGVVLLKYDSSTNTVTGYYNGISIGSYSLASWGANPAFTLGVVGFSGQGANISSGNVTAYNFYAGASAPSDIGYYNLAKSLNYSQTSAASPVIDPVEGYQLFSTIGLGQSGALMTTASLTAPSGGAGTVFYTTAPTQVNFYQYFPTKAALDAAFPSGTGTYTLAVQTNTPNNFTDILTFGTESYPDTPQVTSVTNASWVNGVLVIPDITKTVTLTWTNSTGAYVNLNINGSNGGVFYSSNNSGSTTQYAIAANTLANNANFQASVQLTNGSSGTNTNTIPGNGGSQFAKKVSFTIQTGTGSSPGSPVYNSVVKEYSLVQKSSSGPVDSTPGGNINRYDPGPYTLTAENSVGGTVTVSGTSTTFPLAYVSDGANDNLGDYQYLSRPFATQAALDAVAPNGTYVLPGSPAQSVSVTGNGYPSAAAITLVNGQAADWDAQGHLVLDPTINNTITWSPVTVTNFTTNGNENVHFEADGDNSPFQTIEINYGATSGNSSPQTTMLIPAGSMTPGSTYFGRVSYAYAAGGFNNTSGNNYYVGGYQTTTEFSAIAELPIGLLQAINFPHIADVSAGAPSFNLNATATSGLAVDYTLVSGPATLSGTNSQTVTVTGKGTVVIKASQPGNNDYGPAIDVTQSFGVGLTAQTITFPGQNSQQAINTSITLNATASSNLLVTYVITGPAFLNGNTLTFTGTGQVTVEADQPGDGTNYAAATPVIHTFNVVSSTDLQYFQVGKAAFYNQTSASSVVPDPQQPFQFYSNIGAGVGSTILPSSTLTPPAGATASVTYQSFSGGTNTGLQFQQNFATQAALDATYPSGTYNLLIQTSTPTTYPEQVTVPLSTGLLPTAPKITGLVNATWAANGVIQVTDYTKAVTITWLNSGGGTNASVNINSNSGASGFYANNLSTSYTITAGQLVNNTTYNGNVAVGSNVSSNVSFFTQVSYTLVTGSGSSSGGSNFYDVQKRHELLQTSNASPVDLAGNIGSIAAGPYNASIESPTTLTGTATGPNNTSFPLSYTSDGGTYKYRSGALASASALTALFPLGSYTLTGTVSVTSFGIGGSGTDTYLSPAQVTKVNGSTPVWDAQGRLVLDPTIANTVTWTGPSVNLAANGNAYEQVNLQDSYSNNIVPEQDAGVAGGGTSAVLTESIPALTGGNPTLTSGSTYNLGIQYAQLSSFNGNIPVAAFYSTDTYVMVVAGKAQTISFGAIGAQTVGGTLTLTGTASSNLPVAYTVVSGPATLSNGNVLTFNGVGSVVVQASQPGNATYASAINVNQTITVNKATQSINFPSIPGQTFGNSPFAINATAPGGPVTFSITSGGAFASITASGTVTILGAGGPVVVQASQAGSANYSAATATGSFTISKASQTINFSAIPSHTYGDAPFSINASAVGGPVSYSIIAGASFATITPSGTVTILGAGGPITVQASQAGSTNYLAAPNTTQSFTVNQGSQTITFAAIPNHTYGDAPFTVPASSPGGPVTFSITAGGTFASITPSGTLTVIGAGGPITVQASQPGSANYTAATSASQSFSINKAAESISFSAIPNHTYGDAPFAVLATAPGGNVTFSITSGGTFASVTPTGTVTIVGAGGPVTVTASQAATANYLAAPDVTQSFTINKASQTISFPAIPAQQYPGPAVLLGASATSGLAIGYTVNSGPAALSGPGTLTLSGTGTVSVTATQTGNSNYLVAASQTQTFAVVASSNRTFSQWEALYPQLTDLSPTHTPEGDNIPTLSKYLYNIDPSRKLTTTDRIATPQFAVDSSGNLTLTYRQYALATGITVNVQTSSDLATWSTLTQSGTLTSTTFTATQSGTLDPITNDPYILVKVASHGARQFIRLNVVLGP